MNRSTDTPNRNGGRRRREREILEAATEIFRKRGYADTSVEDIADAVGILKGSLYHYIDSKEDLLFAILESVYEDVAELIRDARAIEGNAFERLLGYVRQQVIYNARNVDRIAVYYQDQNQLSPERLNQIKGRHQGERHVLGLIKEGQATGVITGDLDASLLAAEVVASMVWIHTWYHRGGSPSAERLADFVVEFVRRGLTVQPSSPA